MWFRPFDNKVSTPHFPTSLHKTSGVLRYQSVHADFIHYELYAIFWYLIAEIASALPTNIRHILTLAPAFSILRTACRKQKTGNQSSAFRSGYFSAPARVLRGRRSILAPSCHQGGPRKSYHIRRLCLLRKAYG